MANFTVAPDVSVRFDLLDISDFTRGSKIATLSNSYVVKLDIVDDEVATFTGSSFTYNGAGYPGGGTITSVKETLDGDLAFELTGLSHNAAEFFQFANSFDKDGALGFIFSGNDNLTGNNLDDNLSGYGGHDNLFGGPGRDTLEGGDGNDNLYGQSANGGVDDTDILRGGDGSDYLQGNAGNDSLDGGSGSDRVNGGAGNDYIQGREGNDTINGNLGNDDIVGDEGNDSLRGGQGNDTIQGGDGNDTLSGDLGADDFYGLGGSDIFLFAGQASTIANPDFISGFDAFGSSDKLSIGYVPSAYITGSAQSYEAAAAMAQQLVDASPGTTDVAGVSVGALSFYIFYSSSGNGTIDSAIELSTQPTFFGQDDFI